MSLFAPSAMATVDYDDEISIVYRGAQGELSIKKLPFVGCMGIPVYCKMDMFTFDYKVPSGGCGSKFKQDTSINFLSCAKLNATVSEVRVRGALMEEVTAVSLDLSPCAKRIYDEYTRWDPQMLKQIVKLTRQVLRQNFSKARSVEILFNGQTLR